ncbi:C2 domain [Dillenia turbinata]|uniref:C2 domain n=1 Tax=Dillenia turbinata TaxID=194707 RepID=A0AAN8VPL8_9MAGN
MAPNQKNQQNPSAEFTLKETSPHLGGGRVYSSDKLASAFDLVEQMQYLFVRVVKARDLQVKEGNNGCDPFVEVRLGRLLSRTKNLVNNTNPEWCQVFAFSKERIQAPFLEIVVKDNQIGNEGFMGRVLFDPSEAPLRVPPDSPLAPQWYRLEDSDGVKISGELMLAVWMGTQADEAFPEAWNSDAAAVTGDGVSNIRSKVYLSPKLWYVRVNVIEGQDLGNSSTNANTNANVNANAYNVNNNKNGDLFVRVILGSVAMRTKGCQSGRNVNPIWNEDLMLVAAEPFEENLIVSVEEKVQNKDVILGKCLIPLRHVQKRFDLTPVRSVWCSLEKPVVAKEGTDGDQPKVAPSFEGKVHLRICLDGGYHVLDESTNHSSDLRATARQLWKPSIGVLEVGILSAQGLIMMKNGNKNNGKKSVDAYCVAKYGQKWVRTRTIIDSSSPRWNEQYTWEVFDPCTVVTIGVFDNCHLNGKTTGQIDSAIGKVRIRLSTLETDRVYTHSYPLVVLQPSGLKKTGEIQLAVRFSCLSFVNMLQMYSQPLLPKMHYVYPLTVYQLHNLRHQATHIVSMRLSRAEPPLTKEVVEHMLDVGSDLWSLRRGKANFSRIMATINACSYVAKWFEQICHWRNPLTTILIHILFLIFVIHPQLILPTILFYLFLIGLWHFRLRPRHPPHVDTRMSFADTATNDELDEEFDSFPTTKNLNVLKMRYDRLRSIAGRVQTVAGDLATQGERLQSLLSWRDPRATALFLIFCLVASILLYITPFKIVTLLTGLFILRHPRFRTRLPLLPFNFFRRLPARSDSML